MQTINILDEKFNDANEYTLARCQTLPKGYLYEINQELNIFKILKSFAVEYQDIYNMIQKNINSFYIVDENSVLLDELLSTYGLPNIIFPVLTTAKEKAFAINIMRYIKTLNSVESYETFFSLLGFVVKFYHINETLQLNTTFDYSFPISFSNSISTKDKLTYFVYIQTETENVDNFYNLGNAFPIEFILANNNFYIIKKILDFIKPDYIIMQYITAKEKTLFGIK